MSAVAAIAVERFAVGSRTVELTVLPPKPGQVIHAALEWFPDEPQCLSAEELGEYRCGRNAAVARLAERLGMRIAVVDL